MYIAKDTVMSMQVDANDSQGAENTENPSTEQRFGNNGNDPGFAPISPETPSWGPPSGSDSNDPGFAPISPETPSWGPPSGSDSNNPGFAPISPETPSWGPPSGSGGTTGGGGNICTGCTDNGWTFSPIVVIPGQGNQSGSGLSNVRFLYAATGQPPVNIRLGNRMVINRMQFGNSTPYYLENAGYQTILITNANTGFVLYRGVFSLNNGTAYTFALVNNGSGISLMQITDTPCTNRNAACVRAVNLSPNSGPVDVFLSGAGRVFQRVDTFGITSYRSILQGSYRAAVSEALPCTNNNAIIVGSTYAECNNTKIAFLDTTSVTFMSGVTYTLYLIGRAYQTPSAQLISLESDLVY